MWRDKPQYAVLATHFVERLLYYTIVPNYLLSLAIKQEITYSQLGLFFLAHTVLLRSIPLIGGYFSDRYSERKVLLLGIILEAGSLGTLPFLHNFFGILILGLICALGSGLVTSALYGRLAHLCAAPGKNHLFNVFYILTNIASVAGPLLAWPQLGFYTLWVMTLLPVLSYLIPIPAANHDRSSHPSFWQSIKLLVANKPIMNFFLFTSLFDACYTLILTSVPVLANQLGSSIDGNTSIAINGGTIIVGSYFVGKLIAKSSISENFKAQVFVGFFLAAIGTLVIGSALTVTIVAVGIVVLSVGELVAAPAIFKCYNSAAPEHMRAQFGSMIWIGMAIGEGFGQGFFSIYPEPRTTCFVFGSMLFIATAIYWRKHSAPIPSPSLNL